MFKVYPNQIPSSLIDEILLCHKDFKKSSLAFFRAQGTTHFEKPILNEYGNQVNSIHNPHLLGFNRSFSSLTESIITHHNISNCLSDFTESKNHVWYQSMFFDKSTGTKLHQDTWYLDTIPNGKLVGVWIALEDIEYSAGPFCIYTNSDSKKVKPEDFDFDNIENDINFKNQYPSAKRFDFTAKKGDILIWDSLTIHGALLPKDDSMTRKSITAHFYPTGVAVQSPPIERVFSIYNHSQPQKSNNINILKATTINPLLYQLMCFGLYMLEKARVLKSLLMRERSDSVSNIRRL
jgi:phytanoyl-CoA hydroxylase